MTKIKYGYNEVRLISKVRSMQRARKMTNGLNRFLSHTVIPAKAGIQGRNYKRRIRLWTPAFAGVTTIKNDEQTEQIPERRYTTKSGKRTEGV